MFDESHTLHNVDFRFFDKVANLASEYCVQLAKEFEAKKISELQFATQEICAPAFSEIFAIRELLKLHYLHTSELLLRPLLERISTICYLRKSDESVLRSWQSGWKDCKTRPSPDSRIAMMDELKDPFTGAIAPMDQAYRDLIRNYREGLHSLVHGDRAGSYRSRVVDGAGKTYFAAGPNPYDADSESRIALVAASLTSYLLQEINILFPSLEVYFLGEAS